jgi:polysaccharide export outer membrane protein
MEMTQGKNFKPIALAAALTLLSVAGVFAGLPRTVMGQTPASQAGQSGASGSPQSRARTALDAAAQDPAAKGRPRTTSDKTAEPKASQDLKPAEAAGTTPTDVPTEAQANRKEVQSEENAVVPYYNNFFSTYRLGPEDVISVIVFGQERYSRQGITIPPSGRISLALVPDGLFVNGKTVEEVGELIRKRYDEYIIDPQVSVSLDKAASYRYSIIGDVGQPGIRLMQHRLTVTEAIAEAGGVTSTGARNKVYVLRRQASGMLTPIAVNVEAIYKGKAPDTTYLIPGDQVVVPGNKMKSIQKIATLFPILSFARIFATGGF